MSKHIHYTLDPFVITVLLVLMRQGYFYKLIISIIIISYYFSKYKLSYCVYRQEATSDFYIQSE